MSDVTKGLVVTESDGKPVGVLLPLNDKPMTSDPIALCRDYAADSVAIVRLLRANDHEMAMFIIGSYKDDSDGLQGLVGAMAVFANSILTRVDSLADEMNRSADVRVPGADAVLASAAAAVVVFDPEA